MGQRIVIHAQTVAQFLHQPARWGGPYDIVFADPPYTMSGEVGSLFASAMTDGLLAEDAWVIVEHATKDMLPAVFGRGSFVRRYRYGDTSLSLYAWPGPAQA
jgi:16S rRNA G966 N2-methylase RsmD